VQPVDRSIVNYLEDRQDDGRVARVARRIAQLIDGLSHSMEMMTLPLRFLIATAARSHGRRLKQPIIESQLGTDRELPE